MGGILLRTAKQTNAAIRKRASPHKYRNQSVCGKVFQQLLAGSERCANRTAFTNTVMMRVRHDISFRNKKSGDKHNAKNAGKNAMLLQKLHVCHPSFFNPALCIFCSSPAEPCFLRPKIHPRRFAVNARLYQKPLYPDASAYGTFHIVYADAMHMHEHRDTDKRFCAASTSNSASGFLPFPDRPPFGKPCSGKEHPLSARFAGAA